MEYNTVCGLEVHTELSTKTKIFLQLLYGVWRRTQQRMFVEICAGMPGTLPVVNERVVEYAVRTGLATNCTITPGYNKSDRKNYFYPDLPKAYQISQLYLPSLSKWLCGDHGPNQRRHQESADQGDPHGGGRRQAGAR